jgi:hypothetical protein
MSIPNPLGRWFSERQHAEWRTPVATAFPVERSSIALQESGTIRTSAALGQSPLPGGVQGVVGVRARSRSFKVARGDCDLWQELSNRLAAVPGIATPGAHWDSRRYLMAFPGVGGVRARSRPFAWL